MGFKASGVSGICTDRVPRKALWFQGIFIDILETSWSWGTQAKSETMSTCP